MTEQEAANDGSRLYTGDELKIYKLKGRLKEARNSIKKQDRLLGECELQIQKMASALRAIRNYDGSDAYINHIVDAALGGKE